MWVVFVMNRYDSLGEEGIIGVGYPEIYGIALGLWDGQLRRSRSHKEMMEGRLGFIAFR